jgi:hypothetical protein
VHPFGSYSTVTVTSFRIVYMVYNKLHCNGILLGLLVATCGLANRSVCWEVLYDGQHCSGGRFRPFCQGLDSAQLDTLSDSHFGRLRLISESKYSVSERAVRKLSGAVSMRITHTHNLPYGDDRYLYYAFVDIKVINCKPKCSANDQRAYGASGQGWVVINRRSVEAKRGLAPTPRPVFTWDRREGNPQLC